MAEMIDGHRHLGRGVDMDDDLDSILADMDEHGVSRTVLIPTDREIAVHNRAGNDAVLAAAAAHPDRLLPMATVNPWFGEQAVTGFFRSLPSELEEAGAVDGCSELGIFWRIMMPIATPGLFTAGIFNFVMIWQEFLLAQLLLSSDANKTLPVGLMGLRQTMQYNSNWAAMFAAIMIIVVPSFIVFVALSNRIMAGLTLGAGK
jgi:Binding-protein-dependent transport system inner membrane component